MYNVIPDRRPFRVRSARRYRMSWALPTAKAGMTTFPFFRWSVSSTARTNASTVSPIPLWRRLPYVDSMTRASARGTGAGSRTIGKPRCPRSPEKTRFFSLPSSGTVTVTIADPRMCPASRKAAEIPGPRANAFPQGTGGGGGSEVDGAAETVFHKFRQTSGVVDVRVGGEDEVDRRRRDGHPAGVLPVALPSPLEHAAVHEEPAASRLHEDAGAGDLPRGA